MGYTDKAKAKKCQASAKVIMYAVQAYNADADIPIVIDATAANLAAAVTTLNAATTGTLDSAKFPTEFALATVAVTTLAQVQKISDGTFTVAKGKLTVN